MFFISKLLLIILLSGTYAFIIQNIETTLLPAWNPTSAEAIALTLKVFGKQIQLNLRRNDQIVASTFKIWKHDAKSKTEKQSQLNASDSCYYHHKDHISSAVINFCQKNGLEGVVFLEDVTLEIIPLQNDLTSSSLIGDSCVERNTNVSFGKSHLIKRSLKLFADTSFYHLDHFKRKRRHVQNTQGRLYIELAVFLDEFAYRTFMSFLNGDNKKVIDLVITYVNGIQAVFRHPSLGVPIEISLTHLDIFETQPPDLQHFDGDNEKLLQSFCQFAATHNPPGDDCPNHWDIGLYLTGLDLYASLKNGGKDFSSLGTSWRNSSCFSELSCAVVEFGVLAFTQEHQIHNLHKFWPTKGFRSIYVAAHEIGHTLGMKHDSVNNNCSANYIMGPNIGFRGKTSWSLCSRQIAQELWQTKDCLRDIPDPVADKFNRLREENHILSEWTAKRQCELFFLDGNANVVTLRDACISLQCERPFKNQNLFVGPALQGTYCAPGKECSYGECKPVVRPRNKTNLNEESSWTAWRMDSCYSGCLEKSKGVIVQRRYCWNRNNITGNCEGPSYDVVLCDDSILCNKKRKIDEYLNETCEIFNFFEPELNIVAKGIQLGHDDRIPWQACTIYCQLESQKDIYYAPRVEIIDSNNNPYLPDGTWCHVENGQNYYCRKNYCVPENYQFEQNW